jgi:hypothetical protein
VNQEGNARSNVADQTVENRTRRRRARLRTGTDICFAPPLSNPDAPERVHACLERAFSEREWASMERSDIKVDLVDSCVSKLGPLKYEWIERMPS